MKQLLFLPTWQQARKPSSTITIHRLHLHRWSLIIKFPLPLVAHNYWEIPLRVSIILWFHSKYHILVGLQLSSLLVSVCGCLSQQPSHWTLTFLYLITITSRVNKQLEAGEHGKGTGMEGGRDSIEVSPKAVNLLQTLKPNAFQRFYQS